LIFEEICIQCRPKKEFSQLKSAAVIKASNFPRIAKSNVTPILHWWDDEDAAASRW